MKMEFLKRINDIFVLRKIRYRGSTHNLILESNVGCQDTSWQSDETIE